ncbi:MAG TPA: hypothetical protein VIV40_13005 [Kofleriaceae bacterium]
MNWASWLVWGFASTIVLTTLMAGSQGLGLTRMNIPYLLGTLATSHRDRAKTLGVLLHVVMGWLFSLVYVIALQTWGGPTWWKGGAIGLVHAAFVLAAALPAMPGMHPRMASETRGPTVVRVLEPPGFFGRNYGYRTPVSVVVAHIAFGIILGAFYRP